MALGMLAKVNVTSPEFHSARETKGQLTGSSLPGLCLASWATLLPSLPDKPFGSFLRAVECVLESAGWPWCLFPLLRWGRTAPSSHSMGSDLAAFGRAWAFCCLGLGITRRHTWLWSSYVQIPECGHSNLGPGLWDTLCEFCEFLFFHRELYLFRMGTRAQQNTDVNVKEEVGFHSALCNSGQITSWLLVWVAHKLGLILLLLCAVNSASLSYITAWFTESFGPWPGK